jgi:hypothetical protein
MATYRVPSLGLRTKFREVLVLQIENEVAAQCGGDAKRAWRGRQTRSPPSSLDEARTGNVPETAGLTGGPQRGVPYVPR